MVDYDRWDWLYLLKERVIELVPCIDYFFQQSTRKCEWEDINKREEYMDTLKAKAVIQWKLRLGTQLVDHYIKDHKGGLS
jgi:hypothetical protein